MTQLIQAYKNYKEVAKSVSGTFEAFQNFLRFVYPSQVAETIDYYETKLDLFNQNTIAANARGNLRFNLALAYLGGQELFGSDWDYISEDDVKLLDEVLQSRIKQSKVELTPASEFDLECQMSLEEFLVSAQYGAITPDDGCGNYGTEDLVSNVSCWEDVPKWATKVYWYNK